MQSVNLSAVDSKPIHKPRFIPSGPRSDTVNVTLLPGRRFRIFHYLAALTLLVTAALLVFSPIPYLLPKFDHQYKPHTIMPQSPLTGWHKRATSHPSRDTFVPTASSLQYGMIRSTPANPTQLDVAFFAPDFVVDAAGRVLKLSTGDIDGLQTLVKAAVSNDVPKAGGFRNQWRIKHPRTSLPILWLKVPDADTGLQEVSVYGYSSETISLSKPVKGLDDLPDVLQEVFGVLKEARTDQNNDEGSPELAVQVSELVVDA